MAEQTTQTQTTQATEPTQTQTQTTQQTQQTVQHPAASVISEARVKELIEAAMPAVQKGTQQKENAVLKSFFQQQGLTEDEVNAALSAYKTSKQTEAQKEKDNLTNLQKENETLKAQILQGNIDRAVTSKAAELGVDPAQVAFVAKLADLTKVVNDKGEVDEAKVKEELEKVLKAVPAFKVDSSSAATGVTKIGAGSTTATGTQQTTQQTQTQNTVPTKRWNRFN